MKMRKSKLEKLCQKSVRKKQLHQLNLSHLKSPKRSSIVCDAFVTPTRTGSQIQASTPQSPNDLFCVNIPKDKYLSLDNMEEFQERMAELPGSTDLVAGALSPDTRPVHGISQLTKTQVTLDDHLCDVHLYSTQTECIFYNPFMA